MAGRLDGKRVAILLTEGFEEVEMTEPRKALDQEGAETVLVSPKSGATWGIRHPNVGSDYGIWE